MLASQRLAGIHSYKYAQNLQKSQQQEQQQQLSTNSFHVLIDNTQNY